MVGIETLPNEVLEYILFNVDQETLRSKCLYVSKTWKDLIQCVPFWKRYHRHWDEVFRRQDAENVKRIGYIPDEIFNNNGDWRFFSLISPTSNPFERNLLQNSDGNLVSANEISAQNNRIFEGR